MLPVCDVWFGWLVCQGYLTLDLTKYVDPLMSILVPTLILAMGSMALPGGAVYIQVRSAHMPHTHTHTDAARISQSRAHPSPPSLSLSVCVCVCVCVWLWQTSSLRSKSWETFVSLAGPMANFIYGAVTALVFHLLHWVLPRTLGEQMLLNTLVSQLSTFRQKSRTLGACWSFAVLVAVLCRQS